MKLTLHNYQVVAKDFIIGHPYAAVILDMGMGKTATTLSAVNELMFDRFEVTKVLVIAPLRVANTVWSDEIEQWSELRNLRYSKIVGTPKQRKVALQKDADIYIVNRENLPWLVEQCSPYFKWDMVVIDELSSFKSWQSKRFKAFMTMRPYMKRVVGLTGTPSSNGLMDLFAEFKVIDGGERLGRFIGEFRSRYFEEGRRNGNIVYEYIPMDYAECQIQDKISDITISMKALDYLDMPELISTKKLVRMSEKEKEKYIQFKKEYVLSELDGLEVTAANAASLMNKLVQLSNGAVYSDDHTVVPLHEQKLDALEDILESANGEPVLVAYWFKHDLARITGRLEKLKVTSRVLKTEEDIREWNKGNVPVGLIHPAGAGHGLNLQKGGHHLVWFGLTWSLELYQQTNARLWRQGQEAETVVIQHIVTEGTIDEEILKALGNKDAQQERLIEAVKAQVGGTDG
ncbi:TPA: DEAD/DEAH box helicase [Streptococcus pyogenes]|jgi:SNF2 family DNA or RNA helicase|uniref:Phage helicase n=4 Tax=Streptococcus TaxID=1301 RepID=Q6SZ26_STRPY|nr:MULTISPECIES: DEAD/DEAH box helicase [Streptococcus]AAT72368.1 putative helicase [Streptococcus phage phi1207.3]QBX14859.1 DNA helicase [Streptococcus phage Javan159]QBX19787.1 DNA helicase [Streptococcus phage Javan499]QJD49487.1 DEAD-DEAH box helicase [Streptococcus phage phi29854]QJD49548.1 DEAD-DEAH box helicase [Streptococcus phage phi29961]QKN61644.1 DEAD-DEAHbox helicase [Streptococcus phage phi29862]HEO8363719.1 DEAD/DEAH box helicase [Streptococcus agalactiae]